MRRLAGLHVLVVDDSEDTRTLYARFLEHIGMHVATAGDGHEAIDAATTRPPDVIVMDLSMPVMTGYEAAERLKAAVETRHVPIIALTAFAPEHVARHDHTQFDALCRKPCLPDDLAALIARVMDDTFRRTGSR